jgi:hypothetical protein
VSEDAYLVAGVDVVSHDAEEPEDLQVLLLVEHEILLLVDHPVGQLGHKAISHEILHQELIILEKLLQQVQVGGLVHRNHVLYHEVYPLGNIDLEEQVVAHQFVDHLVDRVVELIELLKLVVTALENVGLFFLAGSHNNAFLLFLLLTLFLLLLLVLRLQLISAVQVTPHEVEQFEKQLADTQVFANHLTFEGRLD